MHTRNQITVQPSRPARCLRHHVWMAACGDCRDARSARVSGERDTTRAAS